MEDEEIKLLAVIKYPRATISFQEYTIDLSGSERSAFIAGYKAALESIRNKVNEENRPTPEIPIDDLRYLNNL